ncbi:MAG: hypothetical protein KatS3mg009_1217 [Acidimicrobiia bacterium]|nr:MAG: hypothetical protein KatS3mg009_1217 [Acidimicrobiia bacterium]
MAGKLKPTPLEAFDQSMEDAELLVDLAEAFDNTRVRRMRRELRERVGSLLKLPRREWDQLDCVESADVFVVLKPGGRITRADFANRAPLLRQAIVAGCAAFETYLGDRAIAEARKRIAGRSELPARMQAIPMTIGAWDAVQSYRYPRRGITERVIGPWLREHVSTSPSKVGETLSLLGVDGPLHKIDGARARDKGRTEADLQRITERRNKIAHEGDRRGYTRRSIDVEAVREELRILREIVAAIEKVLAR